LVSRSCSRALLVASAAIALGAVGCGNDDDDGGDTVALADSGSIAPLSSEIGIPTTVAVSEGVAWVVESQFDRYPAFFPDADPPAPFRLVGVPLAGGTADEIQLPPNFFPEGIAVTRGGRLFVGSVATGAVYTIAPGTAVAAAFTLSLPPSTVGMTVGNDNASLWLCSSDMTAGASMVVGLRIDGATTIATHTLEPAAGQTGTFCNDLVMSPDGSLWVTESNGGQIFRIAADELDQNNSAEVWLQADELAPPAPGQFGVNGITLLNGRLYLAVTDPGTLFSIDPALEEPTDDDLEEIELVDEDGDDFDLVRPDGITAIPGSSTDLLVVQNGLGTDGGKVLSQVRIDRR
jgi:sugar lactone lactonase YvrE